MCYRAIDKFGFLLIVLFSTNYEASELGENVPAIPDDKRVQDLNEVLSKQVSDWGFHFRTYEVITEDDYILKIHRIFQKEENLKKTPVYIMHGIHGCSASYLAYRKSVAYYLAERGYDVWVGNSRGNAFSMKHKDMVKMNPDKSEYWDFSFHEVGYFDLPAFFKKIKEVTGSDRLHYVGMSMGTTVFLVMGATRPSFVKDDVASVTLLAPVARPKHHSKLMSKANQYFILSFTKAVRFIRRGDIYTHHKSIANALYKTCKSKGWTGRLCEKFLRSRSKGKDIFDFENSLEVFKFYPCGTSIKSYQHFIQMAQAGKFQQYDYGMEGNQAKYKQNLPPEYDLGSIDKNVYLLVGGEDTVADTRDVKWLHERLPKSVYVSDRFEHFDHRDFEYGIELEIVHETVLEVIKSYDEGREPKLTVEATAEH